MNNIYIQTLKLGFDNSLKGISFDEVVEKLNIDLSNEDFKISFTIWFYKNFYNKHIENYLLSVHNSYGSLGHNLIAIPERIYNKNSLKSYIKGDAVNQYIDYLELERTRKSALQASYFATVSITIAIMAVILPYLISPDNITSSGKIIIVGIILSLFSIAYSYFIISNAKPDIEKKKKSFWSFSIIIIVLGAILGLLIITLLNKIVPESSIYIKSLIVLPVVAYVVGQIWRKIINFY